MCAGTVSFRITCLWGTTVLLLLIYVPFACHVEGEQPRLTYKICIIRALVELRLDAADGDAL